MTHPDDNRAFLAQRRAIAMSIVTGADDRRRRDAFFNVINAQPSGHARIKARRLWEENRIVAIGKWLIPMAEQLDADEFSRRCIEAGVGEST